MRRAERKPPCCRMVYKSFRHRFTHSTRLPSTPRCDHTGHSVGSVCGMQRTFHYGSTASSSFRHGLRRLRTHACGKVPLVSASCRGQSPSKVRQGCSRSKARHLPNRRTKQESGCCYLSCGHLQGGDSYGQSIRESLTRNANSSNLALSAFVHAASRRGGMEGAAVVNSTLR